MVPKFGSARSFTGFAKFGWLRMLNAVAPNPSRRFSLILKFLLKVRSVSKNRGPRNWLRRWLTLVPVVAAPVASNATGVNCPVLRHCAVGSVGEGEPHVAPPLWNPGR